MRHVHEDESDESSDSSEDEEGITASDQKRQPSSEEDTLFSTGTETEDDGTDRNWASLEEDVIDSASDPDDDEEDNQVR